MALDYNIQDAYTQASDSLIVHLARLSCRNFVANLCKMTSKIYNTKNKIEKERSRISMFHILMKK